MRRLAFAFAFVSIACGSGGSSSLQGPGSFAPNAVVAVRESFGNGAEVQDVVAIDFLSTSPAFNCSQIDAGFPDSGVLRDELTLLLGQDPMIALGTYEVIDPEIFSGSTQYASAVAAAVLVGPTDPPSLSFDEKAKSVSGTVTLTKVGGEFAGSFTVTMQSVFDGGQSTLTGSFDTSEVCIEPL